jgi:hypothetical protein
MNVNPLIMSALSPIFPTIPIKADVYKGEDYKYIVFQYLDDRPAGNADNVDIIEETSIRVNYYTKNEGQTEDLQEVRKSIKKALRNAGFTLMPSGESYDEEVGKYRVYVEAWIAGDSDVES